MGFLLSMDVKNGLAETDVPVSRLTNVQKCPLMLRQFNRMGLGSMIEKPRPATAHIYGFGPFGI